MFVTFSCSKCLKNIMCLCILLIVIDRKRGCLSLHPFPNLSFHFSSVLPSLFLRSSYSRRNGFTADLQRNYLGWIANCLEGNTMSNRGAYSTKERMPSDRTAAAIFPSREGCTWLVRISPFIMYCLPGSWKIVGLIPTHPRFTRMYGVTNRTVFQTVQNLRRIFL